MPFKFLSLVMVVFIFGGCAWFNETEPDFDKPLVTIPEDKETTLENKGIKPSQQQAWVEAKTSRIWVSPHIDENGDYVEGYYKYIVLVPGHWSVNGNQANNQ